MKKRTLLIVLAVVTTVAIAVPSAAFAVHEDPGDDIGCPPGFRLGWGTSSAAERADRNGDGLVCFKQMAPGPGEVDISLIEVVIDNSFRR